MLKLFRKYRLVLRFIFVFIGSYFVLSSFYNAFLIINESKEPAPDVLTQLVARQSGSLMESFGYDVDVVMHSTGLSMKLMVEDYFLAGIVEGCNSASIIILFSSFVFAFFGRPLPTVLFVFAGSVIIYVANIFRIVVLSIGIYEYPKYAGFLHSVFFPLAIYGTVFILWVLWVRIYSRWKRS